MTIATSGSSHDKMNESIDFAERNRKVASSRRDVMLERVRATLQNRRTTASPATFNVMADDALNKDEVFTIAVANEQWGSRLATMYALAELVRAQRETNVLLRKVLEELSRS